MPKKNTIFFCFLAITVFVAWTTVAGAADLKAYQEGGILTNAPNYDWWYGCSATSAGMMMGYYDINGYKGLSYSNLVAGGQAELNNYGLSISQRWLSLANNAIASYGHVTDFYSSDYYTGGSGSGSTYGVSGDDVLTSRSFDCLADFMGTSQDSVGAGNSNGSTSFWYKNNGAKLYAYELYNLGSYYYDSDGMYGMAEYLYYAGYGEDPSSTSCTFYSQYIHGITVNGQYISGGFTFDDYKNEIDAGRLVMIHVEGHSMVGYGYDDLTETIYLYDTWSDTEIHSMVWGEEYAGLSMYGVTCFELTGGTVVTPLPPSVFLMGSGLLSLLLWKRRRN